MVGRDVKVVFTTRPMRHLSGYWRWDLIELKHKQTSGAELARMYQSSWSEYRRSIPIRYIRWNSILKLHGKMQQRA